MLCYIWSWWLNRKVCRDKKPSLILEQRFYANNQDTFFSIKVKNYEINLNFLFEEIVLLIFPSNLSNLYIYIKAFWSLTEKVEKYHFYKHFQFLPSTSNKNHAWNFCSIWHANICVLQHSTLLRDLKIRKPW